MKNGHSCDLRTKKDGTVYRPFSDAVLNGTVLPVHALYRAVLISTVDSTWVLCRVSCVSKPSIGLYSFLPHLFETGCLSRFPGSFLHVFSELSDFCIQYSVKGACRELFLIFTQFEEFYMLDYNL